MTPETSLGFSAVDFAREVLGIEPFPWQRWLLIHALELLPDGRFRFRTVLVEVARQSGKTSLVEMKNLWKMYVLQVPLIIGTAQNLDVAEESWDKAVEIVESIAELNEEIEHIDRTNGKKALRLWAPRTGPKGPRRRGGPRWKIAAASRRGGRGLSGDDVNLDELREHQKWDAWAAVTKTTMAKPNAQIWAYSNAGDDKSVVLNNLRDTAIAAIGTYANGEPADTSLGIFEWSAGDDIKCACVEKAPGRVHDAECKLRDRAAWAQANPSLGYGTVTEEALEAALATDPEPVFRTECLCQRVAELEEGIIPIAQWIGLHDSASKRDGDLSIGVDISQFRDWAAITVYAQRPDGLGHAQLVDYRAGIDWLVPKLVDLKVLNPLAIGMGKGTYESLKADLDKAGFTPPGDPDKPKRGDLLVMSAVDNSAACGQIIDAVRQRSFRVIPAAQLDDAVAGARTRPSGETIAWARKNSTAEISPICSMTAARFTHLTRLWLADKAAQNKPVPMFGWG